MMLYIVEVSIPLQNAIHLFIIQDFSLFDKMQITSKGERSDFYEKV